MVANRLTSPANTLNRVPNARTALVVTEWPLPRCVRTCLAALDSFSS